MKKLLLLSTFAFAGILSANAQHVMSQSNAPSAGNIDYEEQDTLPSVTPGSNGASQTWDLTSIASNNSVQTAYVDPSTTNNASDFPAANVALYSGNQTIYYNSSATGLIGVGAVFSVPGGPSIVLKGKPTEKVFKFPSAYQSSFHDSSVFRGSAYYSQTVSGIQIDSVRITNTTVSDTHYDAYGTVSTPKNTYYNALRENKHSINTLKVEGYVKFGPFGSWQTLPYGNTSNTNTYSWYTDSVKFAVAQVVETIDSSGTTKVTSAQYSNDMTNAIADIAASKVKVSTYPNPAVSELNFSILNSSANSIDVFNVIGEKVETIIIPANGSNAKLNTTLYNSGLYIYKLNNKNGVVTASGKFNVSK